MGDILFYGVTDVGIKRKDNEDNFKILDKHNLIIVCDGMGGHNAGEVASLLAVNTVAETYYSSDLDLTFFYSSIKEDVPLQVKKLCTGIRLANRRIYNIALDDKSRKGMGTTIVSAVFFDNYYGVLHVGDSRAYIWRDMKLQRITKDHSYVQELIDDKEITEEEAENFVHKNVITRALGQKYNIKVDVNIGRVKKGDLFLLCTDGLTGEMRENEIEEVINRLYPDIKKIGDTLISIAKDNGGKDNITVGLGFIKEVKETLTDNYNEYHGSIKEEDETLLPVEDKYLEKRYGVNIKRKLIKYGSIAVASLFLILSFISFIFYRTNIEKNKKIELEINIKTTPDSAKVFLLKKEIGNEEEIGETPVVLKRTFHKDTSYSLRLKKQGYETFTFRLDSIINMLKGKDNKIDTNIVLTKKKAKFKIFYTFSEDFTLILKGKDSISGKLSSYKEKEFKILPDEYNFVLKNLNNQIVLDTFLLFKEDDFLEITINKKANKYELYPEYKK